MTKSHKELCDMMRFRRLALNLDVTEGSTIIGGSAIFNPGGAGSPSALTRPNFSSGVKPCSLDQQDLFEFLDIISILFAGPTFGYVCLPTTPQDEAWEVIAISAYYNYDDRTATTTLNALFRPFLIARGQNPPNPNAQTDLHFFTFGLPGGIQNGGFPVNTVMIGPQEIQNTNEELSQTGIQGMMPAGMRSFIIPPGYTLMCWNGNSGIGNPSGNYRVGMRVVIKRSKTNLQNPIYF